MDVLKRKYNYIELRKDLLKRGHKFKTDSNVKYNNGTRNEYLIMFSLALYDKNQKKFGLLVTTRR